MRNGNSISLVRIVAGLSLVVGGIGVLALIFTTGWLMGAYQGRQRGWARETSGLAYSQLPEGFDRLEAADRFGVRDRIEGNAVEAYWPGGVMEGHSECVRFVPVAFDNPAWSRESEWRAAADCERVNEVVRGAHMASMDLTDWLIDAQPSDLPAAGAWFMFHRRPFEEIGATIARAHGRIEAGDLAGAEADARAAVSAALHQTRGSLDPIGMYYGSVALRHALDHLRVIAERRGDEAEVIRIMDTAEALVPLSGSVLKFDRQTLEAAAIPDRLRWVTRIAQDPNIPLGLRVAATLSLGRAQLANPVEVLLGPSEERLGMLNELAADPVLALATLKAGEPATMTLRRRLDMLAMAW